jgi:AraC-like DNA-binding protein
MLELSSNRRFKITVLHTAFEQIQSPGFRFYGEAHDFWEMVCVVSGVIGISAGSRIATLRSGQAVIHPPMEFHRIWSEVGTSPNFIIFSFSAQNMPPLPGHFFKLSDSMQNQLQKLLRDFKDAFDINISVNSVKPGKELLADKAVCALENFVLTLVATEPDNEAQDSSSSARSFAKIVNVMDANISKKLTVGEIADLCFMSESNMKLIFSEFAGCGVMKYFSLKKANYATSLLQNGVSVSEAAEALGFNDRAYFSTWYKRITGESPGKQKLK